MKRKFLALLLAALMVVSLLPATAFADGSGPKLVPDFNKDGKIDDADVEQLLSGASFNICSNDNDNDSTAPEIEGGQGKDFEGNNKDCDDDYVNGSADLLDFSLF